MNSPDSPSREGAPVDPERLLRSRLRDTTPEFEARFDDLRRRLAQQPPRSAWRDRLAPWFGWRGALAGLAAGTIAVAVLVLPTRPSGLSPSELAGYDELFALDDALRDALPVADAETIEALLLIPTETGGQS
jgi:hypothetical protein